MVGEASHGSASERERGGVAGVGAVDQSQYTGGERSTRGDGRGMDCGEEALTIRDEVSEG
jgi:hypothetical protein